MIFLDWLCGDVPGRSVPLSECMVDVLLIILIFIVVLLILRFGMNVIKHRFSKTKTFKS